MKEMISSLYENKFNNPYEVLISQDVMCKILEFSKDESILSNWLEKYNIKGYHTTITGDGALFYFKRKRDAVLFKLSWANFDANNQE